MAIGGKHVFASRKGATSMSSVDCGRWKLVSSASTTRNRKPGEIKMSVDPRVRMQRPVLGHAAQCSSVRTVVVPAATTRPPRSRLR